MGIMRTTIAVDDHLLEAAKRSARERGQTLGQIVEDALRRELTESDQTEPPAVPVFSGGTGPVPGVDVTSNRALLEALDRDVELDALR